MSVDNFQVLYKLGEGSYSKVFKVVRLSDQSEYALKRVELKQLSESEKMNALNEVRILASIEHANVVSYKEAFFDERQKCLCIVMEYAAGGDLKRRIMSHSEKGLAFEEAELKEFLVQVAAGLKSLHDRSIIHCDLKSANIFLTVDGHYKIGDMNVSKVAKNGMIYIQTGTPYYASPEVWRDEPYNYKSDIWSLGVILYEMATSQLPFKGKNNEELFDAVQNGKFKPLPASFSEEFTQLITRCLSVDPSKRPSCLEILSDKLFPEKSH
jgi:NIMA (never in mitosis gene a)-related kinase